MISNPWQLLSRSFDGKFCWLLALFVVASFVWMRLMLNRIFSQAQSLSTEWQGGAWALHREGVSLTPLAEEAPSHKLSAEKKRTVTIDPPSYTEPIVNRFHLVREGFMKRIKKTEEPILSEVPVKVSEPVGNAKSYLYKDYVIDDSNVKSPLLKKMMERIRE